VEKLIYLAWLEPGTTRQSVADVMLGSVAPALLGLGPHGLSMDLGDTYSDMPAPVATELAGDQVVESLYRDYGSTRWSRPASLAGRGTSRNAVFRSITGGAPPFRGIVEEAWPSLDHVADPMLFFCGGGDPDKMHAHMTQMLEEITAFTDLDTMRSVAMSEWILKS